MKPAKPVINDIDDLFQDVYGLTDEEVEFLKDYLTDCGPNKGRISNAKEDIRSYSDEEAEAEAQD